MGIFSDARDLQEHERQGLQAQAGKPAFRDHDAEIQAAIAERDADLQVTAENVGEISNTAARIISDYGDRVASLEVDVVSLEADKAALLAALKAIVDAYGCECLDNEPDGHCPMCQGRAAIRAAEGR